MTVPELIRHYGLQPHPEGGWYRELHRSASRVRRADGLERSGLTTILFLLSAGVVSSWHRVTGADESWHHAGGAPLELLCLSPRGESLQRHRLAAVESALARPSGSAPELSTPDRLPQPVAIVPAGWWQAARSLGDWSLVSCCVGPGFDFADFSLLRDRPQGEWPTGVLTEFL